jgi:hypothetical protein
MIINDLVSVEFMRGDYCREYENETFFFFFFFFFWEGGGGGIDFLFVGPIASAAYENCPGGEGGGLVTLGHLELAGFGPLRASWIFGAGEGVCVSVGGWGGGGISEYVEF